MLLRNLVYGLSSSLEYKPREELERLQDRRLREIVNRAYHGTRFWHDWLWSANLVPEDITGTADLRRIPICTKRDLLQRPMEDRTAGRPDDFARRTTSGTTGGPMTVFYSKKYDDYFTAMGRYRLRRFQGVNPFATTLVIFFALPTMGDQPLASERAFQTQTPHGRSKLLHRARSRLSRPILNHFLRVVWMRYRAEEILPEVLEFKPDIPFFQIGRFLAFCLSKRVDCVYFDDWAFWRESPRLRMILQMGVKILGIKNVQCERDPFIYHQVASGYLTAGTAKYRSLAWKYNLIYRLTDLIILPTKAYVSVFEGMRILRSKLFGVFRGIDEKSFNLRVREVRQGQAEFA